MKNFSIIVAAAVKTLGIGRNGAIPWKISEDIRYFKKLTTQCQPNTKNAVIMGRKTWESIPVKYRPFADRVNIVLTRNPNARSELSLPDDVLVYGSLAEALLHISSPDMQAIDNVFVIGGEAVYREAMDMPQCTKILFTAVESDVSDCDVFFPAISALQYQLTYRSAMKHDATSNLNFRFCEYSALSDEEIHLQPPVGCTNAEEYQYLNACRDILVNGVTRGDRTGTGTVSKFGLQMRFSLRNDVFPLLTTKRVFWRGVAEELLWFVAGSTDANKLMEKNIHIWDDNGSREFLDSRGLKDREVGDLGPVYGFQWRHFGAAYSNMHTDYAGKGIDQLKECIDKIKHSPEDRRIVLTAWNPSDLNLMALPPCHMFCQFYVANGELSCQMYQRSADMGLGVPFNIASYALLTRMMAQVCNLTAGEFVHTIGDAHIYLNHVEAIQEQLTRVPKPFPTLHINPAKNDIDSFEYSDFTITGYQPDAAIKMKMAV